MEMEDVFVSSSSGCSEIVDLDKARIVGVQNTYPEHFRCDNVPKDITISDWKGSCHKTTEDFTVAFEDPQCSKTNKVHIMPLNATINTGFPESTSNKLNVEETKLGSCDSQDLTVSVPRILQPQEVTSRLAPPCLFKSPSGQVKRIKWQDVVNKKSLSLEADDDSDKHRLSSFSSSKPVIYFALFICLISVCGNVATIATSSGHKCPTPGHKLFLQVQTAGDIAIIATIVCIMMWIGWELSKRR